jgi:hypothetical protein
MRPTTAECGRIVMVMALGMVGGLNEDTLAESRFAYPNSYGYY